MKTPTSQINSLFLVTVGAFMALATQAQAATDTFTGTTASSWSTASNWNSGAGPVPMVSNGDTAYIVGATAALTAGGTTEVSNVTFGGSYNVRGTSSTATTFLVDGTVDSIGGSGAILSNSTGALALVVGSSSSNLGLVEMQNPISGNFALGGGNSAGELANSNIYGTVLVGNSTNSGIDALAINMVNNGTMTVSGVLTMNPDSNSLGGTAIYLDYYGAVTTTTNILSVGGITGGPGSGTSVIEAYGVAGSATGTGVVQITTASSSNTYSGTIQNGLGTVQLVMAGSGTGTQVLSGNNTYTGGTLVTGGVLLANNATSSLGTGAVKVYGANSTNGTLGGTGTIASAGVTIAGTGGTGVSGATSYGILAPSGGATTGTSTLTLALGSANTLSLNTGSKFVFNLGTVASSDLVNITSGTLNLNGQLVSDFTFNQLTGFGLGTYQLIDSTSAITGSFTSSSELLGGYNATLAESGDNLVLNVTAAPEPSTSAMMMIGALLLVAVPLYRRKTSRLS